MCVFKIGNSHELKHPHIILCRTYSLAEFTEVLPCLICNVAQAEVWTVGLFVLMIMTFIEIFLHVTLGRSIFDVSPATDKHRSTFEFVQIF